MHIDDIYFPAAEGNLPLLRERLEMQAVDLNQLLTGNESNGFRVRLPMLFTLLEKMAGNGVNRQVLQLLVHHGADVNGFCLLENDTQTIQVPLLTYAIEIWKHAELAEVLLQLGANPDAAKVETRGGQLHSSSPMLYFAIVSPQCDTMVPLLLRYGADPDARAIVRHAQGFCQELPMLYYAHVQQPNDAITTLLLRGGASPYVITVANGSADGRISFDHYLKVNYPHRLDALYRLCEAAQQQGPMDKYVACAPSKAPDESTLVYEQRKIERYYERMASKTAALTAPRCYGFFSAFGFGNLGILALGLMVIAPLIYLSRDPVMAAIWFCMGLPFGVICTLIWLHVRGKVRRAGPPHRMSTFLLDSLLMIVKSMMFMCIITIPVGLMLASDVQWETRVTSEGEVVKVVRTGINKFADSSGREFRE